MRTTTFRRLRTAIAATALGAALVGGFPATAHASVSATVDVPGGYCVGFVDHEYTPNHVSLNTACLGAPTWARMEIYDFGAQRWVWGNWTRAAYGAAHTGDIYYTSNVYGVAYIQYAYWANGWNFLKPIPVDVQESVGGLWNVSPNF